MIKVRLGCKTPMSTHSIPSPKNRNRTADLKRLARAMVTDRISSFADERMNLHIAEHPDLCMHYVTDALGENYRVNWMDVTEEENADICTLSKEWSDYCDSLFEEVPGFILQALN